MNEKIQQIRSLLDKLEKDIGEENDITSWLHCSLTWTSRPVSEILCNERDVKGK